MRDAVYPGRKFSLDIECLDVPIGLNKNILKDVLCFFFVAHQTINVGKQFSLVSAYYFVINFRMARSNQTNQAVIFSNFDFLADFAHNSKALVIYSLRKF